MPPRFLLPGFQKGAATAVFALFAAALGGAFVWYPQGSALPEVLAVAGKFHPLILHLPIGLLLGAVALDFTNGPLRRHDAAVTLLLWLGFLSGALAVLAGYFLAVPGGYPRETLNLHLWSGISIPVLTYLTLLAKLHHQQKQPLMSASLYRAPLITTAATLMAAGHFGGSMSHGNILDDVRKLIKSPGPAMEVVAEASAELSIYEAVIAPLMEAKCVSCHGLEKNKGELQLHNHGAMLKAGDSGNAATVPGKSEESESVLRILLPSSHDEHMPPENKPQVTSDELGVLQWWIDNGASPDLKVGDPTVPATIREKISALLKGPAAGADQSPAGAQGGEGPPGPEGAPAAPDMAPVQALEKELGVAILPLAQNDASLSFNCVNVADKFGDAELARFSVIAGRMSEMNLSRSKVTDAGTAHLSGMTALKKLHLQNTAVTDAGLDPLLSLTNLEYLNLFNTKVTDAGLAKLEKLPNLKRVFVWQTGVTRPAAEALHAKLPNLVINLGWDQEVKTAAPAAVAGAEPSTPAAAAAADPEKPVYETLIQPIFAAKCISCHGEEKTKGKLKMHTFAELMKNGDSGEASVIPGKSAESLIIKRAMLPLEEDEHMPPSNKDQLTDKELAVLKWWIDSGAQTDIKLKDAGLPDNLK